MLPGEFTSCNRTHNLHGNLADLRTLVAANQKGIHRVQELILSSATFDFEGTSPVVINKLNAPRAISKSVIIYSLRCMVGYDIPLNQGCLAPIPVNIPQWSILDPDYQISRYPVVLKNLHAAPPLAETGF
ncbi:5-oxoprolinase-like [Clavelina lepadiformis]|uniref:5-oxoprolinase-like n=1 Tax=Clavelina lepadiformis TaxID=159417 RepID=UPI0040431E7C